jgi:hypothetical protein
VHYRPVKEGEPPPLELIAETSLMRADQLVGEARPDQYFADGYLGLMVFLRLLEQNGMRLADVRSLLDFGCGAGKALGYFAASMICGSWAATSTRRQIEWAKSMSSASSSISTEPTHHCHLSMPNSISSGLPACSPTYP